MPRRAIHKFKIELVDGFGVTHIEMPRGAIARYIGTQRVGFGAYERDAILLWAEVDLDEQAKERRRLFVHPTGEELHIWARTFIGTALLDGGRFVFHIYGE